MVGLAAPDLADVAPGVLQAAGADQPFGQDRKQVAGEPTANFRRLERAIQVLEL